MKSELRKYKILFTSLLFIFTAILFFLFHYTAKKETDEIEKLALEQARTSFNKDLMYRKWAAMLGGVYVPLTDSVKPNPYLEVEDREIVSTKGKVYTLINPAFMTRQVHSISNELYQIKGHITSLNPINPANLPDKWEQKALNMFEQGPLEYYSKDTINGEIYLRYMGATKVENSCISCHKKQGYKPGDILGGISVSVPYKSFISIGQTDNNQRFILFTGIFIFFMTLLFAAYQILIYEVKKRIKNQQQRLENAEHHKEIIRSAINGFIITDTFGNILEANPSYCKISGYSEQELLRMNLTELENIEKTSNKETKRFESIHKKKDGSNINVEISRIFQPIDGGQFVYFIDDITERKNSRLKLVEAIEKAEESEKRFKSYVEHSPIAVYTTNSKGECIYANEKWLKIAGLTLIEALGNGWEQALHRDDREFIAENWYKSVQANGNWFYEYRFVNKSGEVTWVEGSAKALYNVDNEIIGYLGSNIDITERRIAQQELINAKELAEENESKFRFITENIQDVIWIFDIENIKFTYVSPSVEKMLGISAEEFMDTPIDSIMPSESIQQLTVKVKERFKKFKTTNQKEVLVDEIKLFPKNGKEIWVEIISFYQRNQKTGRIESTGTARDINKRKNTELALHKSEQQYRLLFENMNEAFALHKIITNEKAEPVNYIFVDVNSKFEQLTGLKKENIIGKTVLEIMPNTEKYWIERYGKVALHNEPQEFSNYSIELDRYYKVKAYSPQPEYFAVTFSDVTFQQKAQKMLQESEEKFKTRFEYFPFPTFIWQRKDDDFVMTSANKAAYEQSNGEIESIFGIKSKILWENEPELSDYLNNCFDTKSNFTIERYYYFRGSKKNQYVSTTYSFLPPDNVQITTIDITDKKLAEQEIRNQKKLFETMFNTITDGVIITDTNRVILMANNGMNSTFGYQPEEIIGKSTEILYANKEKFSDSGEKVFNEKSKSSDNYYITYYKDKEENIFPGETFGTKLFDNSGVWIGNVGIMRNISERQKMISDLLIAKEKAEESENKYRNLVETAQELIWKCDNKGKFTYLNQAWELTHGYKLEEMLGKGFNDLQSEEVFQRDSSEFSRHLINGAIKNYETTHIAKNGSELTLLFNAIPVLDADSNVIGAQGTATDITERKHYEKELEEHRNNLEKLVKERTDELEAASEELIANLEELLITRESLLKSEDVLNEVQTLGAIGGWSYDVKSNQAWWTKGLFELHDLPFDRHSEAIQKKTEQSIYCYPENERAHVLKAFNDAINKGKPYAMEHLFTTYKGRKIWVKNVGKPIIENGKTVRVVGAIIDITEQKNAAIQLQSAKDKIESSNKELKSSNIELYNKKNALEVALNKLREAQAQLIQSEKMASLGVLVAGVAHEINNPVNFISSSLSGLKNNLEYLSDYTKLYNQIETNPTQIIKKIKEKEQEASLEEVLEMFRRSVEIIEVGIERTTKIVKGLRAFARSDEKNLDNYDVHENIENTLLILYNQYKNRIEVIRKFEQIPNIQCYPGQINQVIMNILVNAIQAIQYKGKIWVTTCLKDNDHVVIEIKDSGIGIPKNKIEKIFDPFFTTKEVGQGTGLGLSISYGIIQAHYGSIAVESKEGAGSKFTIVLPLKQKVQKS